ncbi:hypothetical protein F5Y12DRAFT_761809 [Xylaria sp. FL1777]|nr:hypothetical protein F5Y12DRAFT_761809 [Xylaria sp. FL1777]
MLTNKLINIHTLGILFCFMLSRLNTSELERSQYLLSRLRHQYTCRQFRHDGLPNNNVARFAWANGNIHQLKGERADGTGRVAVLLNELRRLVHDTAATYTHIQATLLLSHMLVYIGLFQMNKSIK